MHRQAAPWQEASAVAGSHAAQGLAIPKRGQAGGCSQPVVLRHPVRADELSPLTCEDPERGGSGAVEFCQPLDRWIGACENRRHGRLRLGTERSKRLLFCGERLCPFHLIATLLLPGGSGRG